MTVTYLVDIATDVMAMIAPPTIGRGWHQPRPIPGPGQEISARDAQAKAEHVNRLYATTPGPQTLSRQYRRQMDRQALAMEERRTRSERQKQTLEAARAQSSRRA